MTSWLLSSTNENNPLLESSSIPNSLFCSLVKTLHALQPTSSFLQPTPLPRYLLAKKVQELLPNFGRFQARVHFLCKTERIFLLVNVMVAVGIYFNNKSTTEMTIVFVCIIVHLTTGVQAGGSVQQCTVSAYGCTAWGTTRPFYCFLLERMTPSYFVWNHFWASALVSLCWMPILPVLRLLQQNNKD